MRLLAGMTQLASDRPDAVTVADATISAERLWGCARAVADEVAGAPVVAVHATATVETVVGMVGALLAGAAVVPVPPDSGPAERRHLLTDSGAALLLTTGPGAGTTPAGADTGTADGGPALPRVPVDLTRVSSTDRPAPAPTDTALVMYTSGTTGAPKGVLLSHRAVEAGIDALVDAWAWSPDDILVHGLPLFHVHGLVLGVFGALRTGCRLRHTGRPLPERYAAAGGTLYFGVPTVWSRICAQPGTARALADARLLVSGSAALPVPVFDRLHALTGHRPVERYGMTETLITVSSRADGPRRAGYVGFPLDGVSTRVVDEAGRDVPTDGESVGELRVRGPMLFDGYLNRPEATAAQLDADGWFRTGDIASVDPAGWHRIVGRASTDLIKSGGYRIGAGEVEDALLAHPGVREAAVVGRPHADLGEQVTAYVVADGVGEAELVDFVAGHLSVHKRPRQVRFVDALPRNAMGKVQKKLLADD
ncbi:acyl-CoA synthetase [Micromonospora echinofusca]|uniref:AMP-binding protein n=1 Tax=Micromonospora echinofusca TaxID=47858 RepID=A0ABS3VWV4_MICEH|nr:acyl-CoA synthetase [Micromonospora echinofusca]MBO4208980.1 AMP-binding protein [Micromonospora echinofusca]